MGDGDNLTAHVIVEPVHCRGVDETVSNPRPRLNHVCYLTYHLAGRGRGEGGRGGERGAGEEEESARQSKNVLLSVAG